MLSKIGQKIFHEISIFGKFVVFSVQVFKSIILFKTKTRLILYQVIYLGIHSIPIVSLTALFIGMAFSVQVVKELLRFGAPDLVGGVVAIAVWRELGPLMTGVVIAGRVGASIAAEIGTMKVNEQVDALNVMGQNSIDYLVTPRVIALFLLFIPIEFLSTFKLYNSNFKDLISNILYVIIFSLISLILFQIVLTAETQILSDIKSIARAVSFSGFIAIPLVLFAQHSLMKTLPLIEKFSYSLTLIFWIISSQIFL